MPREYGQGFLNVLAYQDRKKANALAGQRQGMIDTERQDQQRFENVLASGQQDLAIGKQENVLKRQQQQQQIQLAQRIKAAPPEQQEALFGLANKEFFGGELPQYGEGGSQLVDQYAALGEPEKQTGTQTDIWRYAGLAEQQWEAQNPGVPMPPEQKMQAMMDIKRAQPQEAGDVRSSQLRADLGLKPQIAGAETGARLESALIGQPKIDRATQIAKDTEKRNTALISRGVLAAESSSTIRRGLELMKTVKTGGVDAAALAVRRTFGVEGADEGELSQALGKAVLSQLRETFGAQFTQEEGNRLIRLEAGFGKSVANNIRLLEQSLKIVERTAKRAMAAAKSRGDMDTVNDIEELLTFSLSMEDDKSVLPEGVSEEDITETMKIHKMTRKQVLTKLGGNNGRP